MNEETCLATLQILFESKWYSIDKISRIVMTKKLLGCWHHVKVQIPLESIMIIQNMAKGDLTGLRGLLDTLMETISANNPSEVSKILMIAQTLYRIWQWRFYRMKGSRGHQIQNCMSALNKLEKAIRIVSLGILEGSEPK